MTHTTPAPLRAALERIDQLARLVAHDLQGRVEAGKVAAVLQCADVARAALAAAPQPAPAAADERAEIERIICDAFTCDLRGRGDEDGAFWQTAADALLAAGYRKADALLAERDAAQAEAARLTAALAEAETRVWQPIETAPKEREHEYSGCGPMIALASDFGHRAVGYWGKGRNGIEGWINPHDHLLMDYWNRFSWWMPLSEPPLPPHERDGQEDQA